MLNVLLHTDATRRWCDRDGETLADLVAHAHRIAAVLGTPRGRVVLSCRHARSFVPGLLGAWLAGATVELLPNVQPGTLDRVDADAEVAYVLHDVAARQDRSPKAIHVPDAIARSLPAPTIAAPPRVAVCMTTSGTTAQPKRVEKTLAQLTSELEVLAGVFPTARCVLSTVPLSHLYGLLFGCLLPLKTGARIVSHDALLPSDLATLIEREGVDLLVSTPAHLRAMAAATMPRDLRVITSGARIPPELHAGLTAQHGWTVTDILGSTETGGIATRQSPLATWSPLPGVQVTAPDGQLVVASPWCEPTPSEDHVELRPDGTFQYVGRNQELVKIAGKRAHAHALEAAVLAVPGVTDAAVLVHGVADKEPRIYLAIVASPAPAREAIADAIRAQFDAVFVPKVLKVVAAIPRTERGKVDAAALRELFGVTATTTIPHRRVAPGEYVAHIPSNLVFVRGHFESFAIVPGAVLVERVVWPIVKAELPAIGGLRKIRRLRFRRPVFPEQQITVTVKHERGRVAFEVSCAASQVASGQLVVD